MQEIIVEGMNRGCIAGFTETWVEGADDPEPVSPVAGEVDAVKRAAAVKVNHRLSPAGAVDHGLDAVNVVFVAVETFIQFVFIFHLSFVLVGIKRIPLRYIN